MYEYLIYFLYFSPTWILRYEPIYYSSVVVITNVPILIPTYLLYYLIFNLINSKICIKKIIYKLLSQIFYNQIIWIDFIGHI